MFTLLGEQETTLKSLNFGKKEDLDFGILVLPRFDFSFNRGSKEARGNDEYTRRELVVFKSVGQAILGHGHGPAHQLFQSPLLTQ